MKTYNLEVSFGGKSMQVQIEAENADFAEAEFFREVEVRVEDDKTPCEDESEED